MPQSWQRAGPHLNMLPECPSLVRWAFQLVSNCSGEENLRSFLSEAKLANPSPYDDCMTILLRIYSSMGPILCQALPPRCSKSHD